MSTEHTMDDRPTGAEPGPTPGEPPTSGSAAASSGDGDRQVKSRSAAPLLPGSAASSSGDGNRGGLPETPTPLLPGTVDLLILKTLSVEANHGYGIARRLRQVSDEVLLVEEGTLYPALHRLEKRGDLESEWRRSERNRRAKYYTVTRQGLARLGDEQRQWDLFATAVGKVLASPRAAGGPA